MIVLQVERDDPRLEVYSNLHGRTAFGDSFIAEGAWVVDRLLDSDYELQSLVIERHRVNEFAHRVADAVPIYCLSRADIKELVGFDFHRGVLACGQRKKLLGLEELRVESQSPALAVIGITDQENLGSLLRTAAAFGIDQILIGPQTIDPFLRRVVRVSMATVFQHRFFEVNNPCDQLQQLNEQGIRTIASTLDSDATDLAAISQDGRPLVVMVGNEAAGLDEAIQRVASDRVRIPMRGDVDSLNVSVAAAILMYQLTR